MCIRDRGYSTRGAKSQQIDSGCLHHQGNSLVKLLDIFRRNEIFNRMSGVIPERMQEMCIRDRSKGHNAPGLYAVLAERGYFSKKDLLTLRHIGSYLQGHPDMKHINGVDMSSGSLGQGISAAAGMAVSAKISGDSYHVYTLLGDGEIQEGQVLSLIHI